MTTQKIIRTSQPQGPVGIDWANPLTKAIRAVVHPGMSRAEAVKLGLSNVLLSNIRPLDKYMVFDGTVANVGSATTLSVIDPMSVSALYVANAVRSTGMLLSYSGVNVFGINGTQWSDWTNDTKTNTTLDKFDTVISNRGATADYYVNGLLDIGYTSNNLGGPISFMCRGGTNDVPFRGYVALAIFFNRALTHAEAKSLSANPWQIFTPIERPIFVGLAEAPIVVETVYGIETNLLINSNSFFNPTVATVLPAIGRPSSDTIQGEWAPSTGTVLADVLKEVVPNDTDYISTNVIATCEIALNDTQYPGGGAQVLRYRANSASDSTITVTLKQGATTIMTRTHALTTTIVEYVDALTPSEIALIVSGPITVTLTSS